MRKIISVLLVLALLLPAACAMAGTAVSGLRAADSSDIVNRLLNTLDFKFFIKDEGIGYGKCPVYTAPSESALRLGNGTAVCNTSKKMDVGGFDAASGWLMVRYKTDNGGSRVGYIPPRYVSGYKADRTLSFDAVPVRAAATLMVTDSPRSDNEYFARLDAGEDFLILGKYTYTGNWWYIECIVDGQTARGFIDRDSSAFSADGTVYTGCQDRGLPARAPEGDTPQGTVTVTYAQAGKIRRKPDAGSAMVARSHPGDRYPYYGVSGRWYRVWIDGVWGWISFSLAQAD